MRFYRQPRTLFKGFRVPDWATAKEQHGWEVDLYSRNAWENVMADFESEWTPQQWNGDRQEPNPLQWFRFEQVGQGFGSRYFYNEVPKPTWWRHGAHFLKNADDDKELDKNVYSFTHANQQKQINFGIDTTTPEGRAQFKKEHDALAEMTPEIISKDDCVFPHEMDAPVPTEPHFRRVW